jgi:glycine hydroxymethyltransferase
VDAEATCRLIVETQPRLVILGSSNFLFPHPVREITGCLSRAPNTVVAYDASHVLGLIACGEFQDPLAEGAHVVFGSTHKTLPGPQGGIIFGNDSRLMDAIGRAVSPAAVTNHHLMRSPALAIALAEMLANRAYGHQVIRNAQALAHGLATHGLDIAGSAKGYTLSHTVMMSCGMLGSVQEKVDRLAAADIMTSPSSLPAALGKEGIRLGTAEVTRRGAVEADMEAASAIIAGLVLGQLEPGEARNAVHTWTAQLKPLAFADL